MLAVVEGHISFCFRFVTELFLFVIIFNLQIENFEDILKNFCSLLNRGQLRLVSL
jgi:hypothetical protein